jgi:hypothetical protein
MADQEALVALARGPAHRYSLMTGVCVCTCQPTRALHDGRVAREKRMITLRKKSY